jgi:hypothetical protein
VALNIACEVFVIENQGATTLVYRVYSERSSADHVATVQNKRPGVSTAAPLEVFDATDDEVIPDGILGCVAVVFAAGVGTKGLAFAFEMSIDLYDASYSGQCDRFNSQE